MPGLDDFERYVTEHGIPKEHYPAAFALWIAEVTGGPVPRFEKVEREPPADGVVIEGDDLKRRDQRRGAGHKDSLGLLRLRRQDGRLRQVEERT